MGHHTVARGYGGMKHRFLIMHIMQRYISANSKNVPELLFSKTSDVTFPIGFDVERLDRESDSDRSELIARLWLILQNVQYV